MLLGAAAEVARAGLDAGLDLLLALDVGVVLHVDRGAVAPLPVLGLVVDQEGRALGDLHLVLVGVELLEGHREAGDLIGLLEGGLQAVAEVLVELGVVLGDARVDHREQDELVAVGVEPAAGGRGGLQVLGALADRLVDLALRDRVGILRQRGRRAAEHRRQEDQFRHGSPPIQEIHPNARPAPARDVTNIHIPRPLFKSRSAFSRRGGAGR